MLRSSRKPADHHRAWYSSRAITSTEQNFPVCTVSPALKRFATIVSHRTKYPSQRGCSTPLVSLSMQVYKIDRHGSERARRYPGEQQTSSRRTSTGAPPKGASMLLQHTRLHLGDDPKFHDLQATSGVIEQARGWTPYFPAFSAPKGRSHYKPYLPSTSAPRIKRTRAHLPKQKSPRVCPDVLPRNLKIPRRSWKSFLQAV